jgi:aldehyde:ferredoxin oxidoreductase
MQENLLFVDLSAQTFRLVRDKELFDTWLGGTAAGTELLFRHCPPDCDPLGPDNPVIFVIGPLSGLYPVATKTVTLFKSPLTGELGESHAGGRLAAALREADIDALVITGRAPHPTFLTIDNHEVRFHSARTVWGKSSLATERILRDFDPQDGRKSSVVRIGPAGERLSPLACATVDSSRHFGRLGLGAVLGAKNLKAILVSGSGAFVPENLKSYRDTYQGIYDKVVHSGEMRKYHDLGTAGNILTLNAIRGLPTRNFSQGYFEGAEALSGENFAKNWLVQHTACAHCQCGCIHVAEIREEFKPYHYRTTKVPYDYEPIYALGTQLSLASPEDVLRLILAVEKEGWDAMSMGCTLAWASEAFLSGVIGLDVTEGLPIQFGDVEGYLEVLNRIRTGAGQFYRDLEKGTAHCAAVYGGERFAMHFGRVEPAGYLTGENALLTWIVGVRHSHLDDGGYSIDQKLLGKPQPLREQVATQVKDAQWRMVTNSLVTCLFARSIYDGETTSAALAALGISRTPEELRRLGEETLRRKHAWKRACGFFPEKVAIPEKLFSVQTSNGPLDRERMAERVRLYLELADIPPASPETPER